MPTTFIPALNQARLIDWPIPWSEPPSKRNTDPVSLSKKKGEHEKEITFTALKEERVEEVVKMMRVK